VDHLKGAVIMNMRHDYEPLPPYTDPRSALKIALPSLRPAEQISVTAAAERYMRVNVSGQWQPFRRDVTPYMVEPTDMIASRRYRGLAFCGPSQSGKTQMLQAAIAYTIASDPGRVALFQMTRDAAAEFERNKLAPTIRNSPELRQRLATGRGADNMYQKLFSGGTQLTLDWPTITKLSSTSIRLVLGTDYDHFPESIDGEGDAYTLMRARARSFLSRGMVVVESSPGAPLTDETWRPQTPHDCPPVKYGVLSLYPEGTRGRWYWPCPCCGVLFEPTFDLLVYPDSLDPVEQGEAAVMRCPHCANVFEHVLKRELNEHGSWLHETDDGKTASLASGKVRRADLLSYWLDGAAASFSSWKELVTQYESAVRKFKLTGDEESLKTAMNTGQARPYQPRGATSDMEVTLQGLKDKARGNKMPKGIAPAWTKYVTVEVDVQGTYFSVGATAWGALGRHQPIDRFELNTPPASSPGVGVEGKGRTLKPFEIAEDWDVLIALGDMSWPIEGCEWSLKAIALSVDQQGGGATTDNAYSFYRGRKRAGQQDRWFITRGRSGANMQDRVWLKAPESASGKRRVAKDILTLNMATDRIKDAVATSLRLTEAGQNHCAIAEWMSEAELLEFTAERRTAKGWEKRPGMVRNESLDHLVMARAKHIWIKGERINWKHPPSWAVLAATNPVAVWTGAPEPIEPETFETPTPMHSETHGARKSRGSSDWINPRKNWF
jgi:phage terminase large subunit GpA-like protein